MTARRAVRAAGRRSEIHEHDVYHCGRVCAAKDGYGPYEYVIYTEKSKREIRTPTRRRVPGRCLVVGVGRPGVGTVDSTVRTTVDSHAEIALYFPDERRGRSYPYPYA